jgi:hypothetical protein
LDADEDDLDPAAQVKNRVVFRVGGGGAQDLGGGFQAVAVEVGFDLQEVGTGAKVADGVASSGVGAEDEGVASPIALQVVVAAPAGDAIVAAAPVEKIGARSAAEDVVAFRAEQDVDALAAADGVGAGRAVDQFVVIGCCRRSDGCRRTVWALCSR